MKTLAKKFNMMIMMMIVKLTPSCETISKQISESLDHRLSVRKRLTIRLHTWQCVLCDRYRRQLLAIHNMLKTYSDAVDSPLYQKDSLTPDMRKRIKDTLRQKNNHTR
ncbi:MAG: hypothetical protein U5R06_16945 [candidate division KSB1 bacterium]|nr:hypothetical protein [candidate division KSB1 bacterium]